MEFKVIYKKAAYYTDPSKETVKHVETVTADSMAEIDETKLKTAFMVVAKSKISNNVDPYIAIVAKTNLVLVGNKAGMTRKAVTNIYDALHTVNSTPTTYTLTFVDDYGVGTVPSAETVTSGSTVDLSSYVGTPTDGTSTFEGWTDNSGNPVTSVTVTANTTVHASWN